MICAGSRDTDCRTERQNSTASRLLLLLSSLSSCCCFCCCNPFIEPATRLISHSHTHTTHTQLVSTQILRTFFPIQHPTAHFTLFHPLSEFFSFFHPSTGTDFFFHAIQPISSVFSCLDRRKEKISEAVVALQAKPNIGTQFILSVHWTRTKQHLSVLSDRIVI